MSKTRALIDFNQKLLAPNFNPASVPNLFLWLDGQDSSQFNLSGSDIVDWLDKSGNGRDFTRAGVSNSPQLLPSLINGNQAVSFGLGDRMDAGLAIEINPASVYVVCNLVDGVNSTILLDNNTYSLRFEQWQNTGLMGFTHYGVADYTSMIASPSSRNVLVRFQKMLGESGINVSYDLINETIDTGGDKPIPFGTIGRSLGTFADNVEGSIGEFLVYDRVLSNEEDEMVRLYLNLKWGL